jgi:hypothetical protein
VVKSAKKMVKFYKLSKEETFILLAAAWFHDVGYLTGAAEHEEKSSKYAQQFLPEQDIGAKTIAAIMAAISITKLPQKPTKLIERIICDADLFHLGTSQFWKQSEAVRLEISCRLEKNLLKFDWLCGDLKFVGEHHFHTYYGKKFLQPRQNRNQEKIGQLILQERQT